jgi:cell division protease FtsH
MICHYGMNDRIGPVSFGDEDHDVFLGRDFVQRKEYSERKAQDIDEELTTVLTGLYEEALKLLEDNREILDRISEALLERETLEAPDLALLVEGKPLPPMQIPETADDEPPKERAEAETTRSFPGGKLPDPEPVPG